MVCNLAREKLESARLVARINRAEAQAEPHFGNMGIAREPLKKKKKKEKGGGRIAAFLKTAIG